MSTYLDADLLSESIESVLGQDLTDFEFIIVNDGSSDSRTDDILADYARRDDRIRVIAKENEALTRALIDGCAAAQGTYIARIDVGDRMTVDRLRRQKTVLDRHPEVVLVTCWTEFCGPEWESLYTVRSRQEEGTQGSDYWFSDVVPSDMNMDLLAGPTNHGSVMFRTDAYRAVGGYRWQFYYGQDWDLWYRLAERGKFAGVQDTLSRCRVFPAGISMRNAERQRRIRACSFRAFQCRRTGEAETMCLDEAAAIRPPPGGSAQSTRGVGSCAAGQYFVGEALRRKGERKCRQYLRCAIRERPTMLKAWFRLAMSVTLGFGTSSGSHH